MQPQKGSNNIEIPITFDSNGMKKAEGLGTKILWTFISTALWFLVALYVFFGVQGFTKILLLVLSFWLLTWIIRFIIIKEKYYMKNREELIDNNYAFDYKLFWNIIDIKNTYPHIAQFGDGRKGIFVFLDKDVIVGKGEDDDFYHYETLADAYSELAKANIAWEHIDYMDVAGKDSRLKSLFKQVENVSNTDLKNIMLRKYDYLEYQMNNVYSTYDVYAFYSTASDENFWYDLEEILSIFLQANYSTYRVLDKEGLGDLARTLMNIEEFSVNQTMESLYSIHSKEKRLTPIWVEKDGVREKINDTREERAEKMRVAQQERKVQKGNSIPNLMKRKNAEDEMEIDLFGERDQQENEENNEHGGVIYYDGNIEDYNHTNEQPNIGNEYEYGEEDDEIIILDDDGNTYETNKE